MIDNEQCRQWTKRGGMFMFIPLVELNFSIVSIVVGNIIKVIVSASRCHWETGNVHVRTIGERVSTLRYLLLRRDRRAFRIQLDEHWYFPGIHSLSPASVNGEFSLRNSSRMPSRDVANAISWARRQRLFQSFDLFVYIQISRMLDR